MKHLLESYVWFIDESKITNYLLGSSHPAGRTKAAFFQRFGFDLDAWETLRQALYDHSHTAQLLSVSDTEFGKKYSLEGLLKTPLGRAPNVRVIWFAASGEMVLRLVTAYPAPGGQR